jgi:hypothetical protein
MTVTVTASGTPLSVPRAPLMTRAVTSRPGCTVVQLLQLAGSVHWPGPTAAGDRLGLSDIPSHWQASKTSGFELELGPGRGHPNGSHMMLSDTVTANDRASDLRPSHPNLKCVPRSSDSDAGCRRGFRVRPGPQAETVTRTPGHCHRWYPSGGRRAVVCSPGATPGPGLESTTVAAHWHVARVS